MMNEWPKQIPHEGGEAWSVGIAPLRDVLFVPNKRFQRFDDQQYCQHAQDGGLDPDGDPLVLIPRTLFSGHVWATGNRDVHWLCLDCILEAALMRNLALSNSDPRV